jgi:integrase
MLWNEAIGLASRQEQSHGLSDLVISLLRQRMIEDMRSVLAQTQNTYLRAAAVVAFLSHARLGQRRGSAPLPIASGRSGISPISLNAAITALKFSEFTVGDPERMAKMTPVQVLHKLPVILSREEVRLIEAAGTKYQAALSVAYAGLRASEVVALKVGDIDSRRMVLRVEQGKGHGCYAMLPPVLLERLRAWRRYAHAQGKMLEGGWLFRQNPIDPPTPRQLNRAVHAAAVAAHRQAFSMHTLRHCFATHLLEQLLISA